MYTSTDVEVLGRLDDSGPVQLRDRARKQGPGEDHEYLSIPARDPCRNFYLWSIHNPDAGAELVWCIGPEMGRIISDNFCGKLCSGIAVNAIRRAVLAPVASVAMPLQGPLHLRQPSLDEEQEPAGSSDRLLDLPEEDEALQNLRGPRKEGSRAVG